MKKVKTTIYLSDDVKAELERMAHRDGLSLSRMADKKLRFATGRYVV